MEMRMDDIIPYRDLNNSNQKGGSNMTTEVYRIIVKAALHAFLSMGTEGWRSFTSLADFELLSEKSIETCYEMTNEIDPTQSDQMIELNQFLLEQRNGIKRILKREGRNIL